MKRIVLIVAATVAVNAFAGTGATTNWVASFVSDYVSRAISNSTANVAATAVPLGNGGGGGQTSSTNAVGKVFTSDGYRFSFKIQPKNVPTIIAYDASQQARQLGVTNGVHWIGGGSTYSSKGIDPIVIEGGKLMWRDFSATGNSGAVYFTDGLGNRLFGVKFSKIQEIEAKKWRE